MAAAALTTPPANGHGHAGLAGSKPVTPVPMHAFLPIKAPSPLQPHELAAPPCVSLVEDDLGFRAKIEPEDARAILRVECQIHIDMVYVVTVNERNEFVLWRLEHAGLAPARLSTEMKQRLLSAPGVVKRWTTGDYRMHELETDGRHDMQSVVLTNAAGVPEFESYISLGTMELSDSDWLRNWLIVLDNARRIAGAEFNVSRVVKLT